MKAAKRLVSHFNFVISEGVLLYRTECNLRLRREPCASNQHADRNAPGSSGCVWIFFLIGSKVDKVDVPEEVSASFHLAH